MTKQASLFGDASDAEIDAGRACAFCRKLFKPTDTTCPAVVSAGRRWVHDDCKRPEPRP